MILEEDDFYQFAKLHWSLLLFVNRSVGIFPGLDGTDALREVLSKEIEAKLELFRAFYETPAAYIDAWLAEDSETLSGEDREIVESWKSLKHGKFIVFRQLKKHAVFLDTDAGGTAYAVLGLTESVADALDMNPPAMVETALLPFKGMIVYDGLMSRYSVHFGGGIRKAFNEQYKAAKEGPGLVVSLSPLGVPGKKRTAADRVRRLAEKLRGSLGSIRDHKHRIRDFEENVEPPFRDWLRRNLGDLEDRMRSLEEETDRLARLLEAARISWRFREHRTRAATIDALEEEMREEEEMVRSWREGAGEEKGDGDDPFPFPDTPFDDLPDFMLDPMLAEFLMKMRGVDFYRLSAKEKKKAREDFQTSFVHAASGDRNGFEKAMLKIGADESDANQAAVKKVFRRLARQVHPDRNEDFNEEAKEIWEELQMRKTGLDLESLVNLETKWRLIRNDRFDGRDEKRLKELLQRMRDENLDLEIRIEELSDHPMWGRNPSKTPPKAVQKRAKRDLEELIAMFERDKAELEREIAAFRGRRTPKKKQAKKKAPRKRPSARPTPTGGARESQMDFDFGD